MRFVSIVALVVAAMVLTVGGIELLDYVDGGETTTQVTVQDGLRCTINGTSVQNGGTIVTKSEECMSIHIESSSPANLAFSATWSSDKKDVHKEDSLSDPAKSADFCVKLDRKDYTGHLSVYIAGSDGDLGPINLTFHFDESQVKVTHAGTEVKNGDVVSFPNDGHFTIESKIGRCNLKYSYSWSNPDGFQGSGSYSELNTSIQGSVVNTCYFDAGTGDMNITASLK